MTLNWKKWLFILAIFSCSICVNAQKKVSSKTLEKASVNYQTIVEIDENSRIKIFIESPDNSADLVGSFFSVMNQKTALKKLNSTEIIVKPNSSLRYGEVVDLVKNIRKSPTQNIQVEISNNLLAVVSKPLPKMFKPNPLFLLVRLDKDGKISLNNEPQGTINNLMQLTNFLKAIFKERIENGVLREGTNEVEASVFIEVPPSVKFSEVIKIAQALQESGTTPIGLQIDEFVRITQIDEIK